MTDHPRKGDKKRTLNKYEMQVIRSALGEDIRLGGSGAVERNLLTDFENAKRVVIVTTKR